MVYNALAATAVATVMGLSDEEIGGGISSVEPVGEEATSFMRIRLRSLMTATMPIRYP